jgi:hypothetical protein
MNEKPLVNKKYLLSVKTEPTKVDRMAKTLVSLSKCRKFVER